MTDQDRREPGAFECVEPHIGEQLWQRTDPDLDANLMQSLDDHLVICDACQVKLMVEDRIADQLKSGELSLDGGPVQRPRRWSGLTAVTGGLALAASLVLMFSLPPTGSVAGLRRDGDNATGFVRPVEGEIVEIDNPKLSWTPVAGATAYTVEVAAVDGAWSWSGRTQQTTLNLPPGTLPGQGRYRALVEPIPVDLAGLAETTVFFERSGLPDFVIYRVTAARVWVQGLGGLGLLALVASAWLWYLRRGTRPLGE